MTEESTAQPLVIGQPVPTFTLPSLRGETVSLADYRPDRRVILWFSRGFTCTFCRGFIDNITAHYDTLQADHIAVIQIAPNLLSAAQRFFRQPPPYPFVCDPDKQLFARYGLGDRGVLEASRNTVISFAHAFTHGDGLNTVGASAVDVFNSQFLRRLQHHAMTAVEQGIFIVDGAGTLRHRQQYSAIDPIPLAAELRALTNRVCL